VSLERLIWRHTQAHAGFGVEDLAKLLYQGVMGMDHLLEDRERFIEGLRQEWETLAPARGEALCEPVHPFDPIVRLNLRPVKAAGVHLMELGPLLADQPRREGRISELWALWEEAVALAGAGKIPFRVDELARWGEILRARGHAPGHSLRYRELNRPAYRLIHDVTPEVRRLFATREGHGYSMGK